MSASIEFRPADDPSALAAFVVAAEAAGGPADSDPVDGAVALAIAGEPGAPSARASLWLAGDLAGAPGISGLVGHYAAANAGAGAELLHASCAELARRGAVRVIGPMNGHTWRRYRLELPRESGDPDVRPDGFASEPRNPLRYNDEFLAAGFQVVSRYESRYEPEPVLDPHSLERERARAEARGVRLHALDPARFDEALRAMHALSLEAFADNAWYAPLPLEAFLSLYAPLRARAVPELVRLATRADGKLAGYLFGFPDPLSAVDGRPTRTVCKTVAVAPHARGAGLGGLLLDEFRAASISLGASGILHALMHVSNASMRMSARHHSVLFKRYALYGWTP
ncbi:MAG: GNAT family N-acetyltransferase [Candidatus Eisenbacteria bacterium]